MAPVPAGPVTQCAWCGDVRIAGEWLGSHGGLVDELTLRTDDGHRAVRRVSHGICPLCLEQLRRENPEYFPAAHTV